MDTLRIWQLLICLAFSTIYIQPVSAAQVKCYSMLGNLITDSGIVPCNPSATGGTGSHSSCCNQRMGDVCLSTGLCLSTKGKSPSAILWTNGCTDPTWNDPSCPQYCNPPFNSTGDSPNPTLRACTKTTFCCRGYYKNDTDDDKECCKYSFSLSQGMGRIERILVQPEDADPSGSPSSTPSNSPTDGLPLNSNRPEFDESTTGTSSTKSTAITAGILGTLLLAVSIALGLMVLQNRRLKKSLADEQARATTQPLPSPEDGVDHYKYHHQGHIPQEVADPHYSPPAWIPSEMPSTAQRAQLPG